MVAEQASRPAHAHSCGAGRDRRKTQVSWSPIASWIRMAATELSTPPDRPQMTRLRCRLVREFPRFWLERNSAMVQSPDRPHIIVDKMRQQFCAVGGVRRLQGGTWWCNSGAFHRHRWQRARWGMCRSLQNHRAQWSPGRHGSSRRDISVPLPKSHRNNGLDFRISTSARPNSAAWPPSTVPPNWVHNVCCP